MQVFIVVAALLALAYGVFLTINVLKKDQGNAEMREIAAAIQAGARAYLNRQYRTIAMVAVVLAVIMYFAHFGGLTVLGFLIGAITSAFAGYIGMNVAVRANVRTAEAAKKGLGAALGL